MRKLNITVLVGLLVAALGFALVFAYGSRVDDRVAEGRRTVGVLTATAALPAGATPAQVQAQVQLRQVPAAFVAQGALADLATLQGKVLLGPVAAGAQLTRTAFGAPSGRAVVQPAKGRVALAIPAALTPGVAGYVGPGSVVDLFVTYGGGSGGTGGARTKLFLSGIGVLSTSVAGTAPEPAAPAAGAAPVTAQPAAASSVAVLDLSPKDAEKVVNATTLGQVYLALTSGSDGTAHRTAGVTPADVLGANR